MTIPVSNSPNKGYLLDANAAIARINGEPQITAFLRTSAAVHLSIIVVGELFYGAEKSSRPSENRAAVDEFINGRSILICDSATARWYGRIHAQLRRKGRPIPQNDIWIAATAMQHDLVLLTKDQHFQQVDGLNVESW